MDDFLAWYNARVLRRTGRHLAPATLRSVRTRLRSAMRATHTDEVRVLSYTLIDADACNTTLDRLALTNSPGSLRLVYEACAVLHKYAVAQGWVDGEFAMEAPAKNPQPPIVVYRPEEVDLIVEGARVRDLRWFTFVATLAHTGRRAGEVLGLEWERLHLDADVPHFDLPHTKNKRQAFVPLDTFLREQVYTEQHVENLRGAAQGRYHRDPYTFPFPWSYNCAHKMFRAHCVRLGVPHRGFHRLRHTKATEMLAKGVPIQAVSGLLGHASVQTTDRLYHHATTLDYAKFLE